MVHRQFNKWNFINGPLFHNVIAARNTCGGRGKGSDTRSARDQPNWRVIVRSEVKTMTSSNRTLTIVSCAGLCIGLAVAQLAWSQSAATSEPHKERARVVLS